MKKFILILISTILLTVSLTAQFKVVQSNPNNYSFNITENAHQLTDGSSRMQATAIWNNSSIPGFENIHLNVNFLVEAEYYLGYKDLEGADGIVFVLQSAGDDKLGSMGVGMGYAANPDDGNKKIAPSLGVEMDTHYNPVLLPLPIDDNPEDHFEYLINGELMNKVGLEISAKEDLNGTPLNIEDSTFHCVKFFWNSANKELSSYLDGQFRKKETFDGVINNSLTSILQTDLVNWGFTTGTANLDNIHMVRFDKITRGDEACFVEIYKESTYDVSNPNCGFKGITICKNNPENKINLHIATTQLPINRIEWESKNNTTIITPINLGQDKVNLQMKDNDVIEVTVFYSNGCVAKDEFVIYSKDIEIISNKDTIILCQTDEVEVDLDLKINGETVDNSDGVNWSWTNTEYIVNQGELTDKVQINLKNRKSDTIRFVVTVEESDSLSNRCVDEVTITVIVNNYYFNEKMTYSPCNDTAYIEFEVFEDEALTTPLPNVKIKKASWISPNSINDYINGIVPNGLTATVVTEGKYEIKIDMTNGCHITKSVNTNFSKVDLDLIPGNLKFCRNDSISVESKVEAIKYLWSTGDTTKGIEIWKAGEYTLEIVTNAGCQFYDTLEVVVLPDIEFNIVGDSIICNDRDFVTLKSDKPFEKYQWSNGSSADSIEIDTPGLYWLKVTNVDGCSAYDEIIITNNGVNTRQDIDYPDTINIGKVYYEDNFKFKVNLKNKGSERISITSKFNGTINSFELSDSTNLVFPINPNELGAYSDSVVFVVEQNCPDTFYVYVIGSVFTKVVLELPQVIASPGEQTYLPIKLRSKISFDDNYTFDLNYDSDIIYLVGSSNPINFTRDWRLNGSEQIIENPSGTVLLMDLSEKAITVDTLLWENKFIESEIINGWIRLDTICVHEYRVIEINYEKVDAFYNLDKDKLVIQKIGSDEASEIEVSISSLSGVSVLTKNTTITDTKELDLSNLTAGVYFVKIEFNGLSNLYKFIKMY
ncbi:MAG: hypothetical protein CVV25_05660 [Ignavibacteriae bacterium HGW-Ignavibacteriae-4]|nr:MAG: hypothetical protein CVV25_05660 [Ignavibacteriae bacterium HGW-Ignavibacteriae-4]